jgi:hypothetical protein
LNNHALADVRATCALLLLDCASSDWNSAAAVLAVPFYSCSDTNSHSLQTARNVRLMQAARVLMLVFVAREGAAAPTNPSKIVWVATLYLVFCLMGTVEAFALRHDMM